MEQVANLEGGSGFCHDEAPQAHGQELAELVELDAASLLIHVGVVLGLGVEHVGQILEGLECFHRAANYWSVVLGFLNCG